MQINAILPVISLPGFNIVGVGRKGGGGENGGAPGQGFFVAGPHNNGLLAKLQRKWYQCKKIPDHQCIVLFFKCSRPPINLIGVNNEKEPVDGTSPDRLLLERSLHSPKYKKTKKKSGSFV